MSLSDYGENLLLALLKANKTLYLALFTATPADAGGGTEVSTAGTGYARQQVAITDPASGAVQNSALVQFPTALAAWGTVTSWGLFDAATDGNLVWYGDLSQAEPVNQGNIYQVPIGNLVLNLD